MTHIGPGEVTDQEWEAVDAVRSSTRAVRATLAPAGVLIQQNNG